MTHATSMMLVALDLSFISRDIKAMQLCVKDWTYSEIEPIAAPSVPILVQEMALVYCYRYRTNSFRRKPGSWGLTCQRLVITQ